MRTPSLRPRITAAPRSPCVLANLWDVTDIDIDRFTSALLRSWLGMPLEGAAAAAAQRADMLQEAVVRARGACLMPFLVGAAPVCFGLPVATKRRLD
jgi:separase